MSRCYEAGEGTGRVEGEEPAGQWRLRVAEATGRRRVGWSPEDASLRGRSSWSPHGILGAPLDVVGRVLRAWCGQILFLLLFFVFLKQSLAPEVTGAQACTCCLGKVFI